MAMLSKKHFIAFASILNEEWKMILDSEEERIEGSNGVFSNSEKERIEGRKQTLKRLVSQIQYYFQTENSRFDSNRFENAVYNTEEKKRRKKRNE
jgi:hypothetical protein